MKLERRSARARAPEYTSQFKTAPGTGKESKRSHLTKKLIKQTVRKVFQLVNNIHWQGKALLVSKWNIEEGNNRHQFDGAHHTLLSAACSAVPYCSKKT